MQKHQYAALILGATIAAAAKLAACVVVRFVYGANYVAAYVAGDWRTAKLMISLFWMFTIALSLGLLVAGYVKASTSPISQHSKC